MGVIATYYAVDTQTAEQLRAGWLHLPDIEAQHGPTLFIDKTWNALYYILNGCIAGGKPPMGDVIPMSGDTWLESEADTTCFLLPHVRVGAAADAVREMTEQEFRSRYNFEDMKRVGIYPVTLIRDDAGYCDILWQMFGEIRKFLNQAVRDGSCVLMSVLA